MNKGNFSVFPEANPAFYTVNDRDLNRCTARQRAYIYGLLDKAQMSDDDLIEALGLYCNSVKEFSIDNAKHAIDYLKEYLGWN